GTAAPATASAHTGPNLATIARQILLYTLVTGLGFIFAAPLIWMISTSLKTDPQVYTVPPVWIPNPVRWVNYPEALAIRPFGLYTYNTLKYALTSVVGVLLSCSLVAYGFARVRWPGRDIFFF